MFNFTAPTRESHDTAMELVDSFNVEGLSLGYRNGEWVVTDSATGSVYFTAEYAWEVRDYLNEIDNDCLCDGSDDAPYTCTFPPCVATSEGAVFSAAGFFASNPLAFLDAYDRNNPKHPDYADSIIDRIDTKENI